jgi:protein-disulfide isomerase
MFWAQATCAELLFPQPAFEEGSAASRHYADEASFPTWVGIEQGVTDEGFPTLGSADASIIVAEFGDFGCPHCLAFLPDVQALTDAYVRDGRAQLVYVPLTFVAGKNSVNAAEAAICAADQGAFWQLHQVIFEIQESQGATAFTTSNLVEAAEEIGLDGAALEDCMQSVRPEGVLSLATEFQRDMEVGGTPSIVYSLDGGETWTLLPDRTYANIVNLIEMNAE